MSGGSAARRPDRRGTAPGPVGGDGSDGGGQPSLRIIVAAAGVGGRRPRRTVELAVQAARRARPDATVSGLALSDGGPGFVEAVANPTDRRMSTEVAGPFGHPREVGWLLRTDGTAVLEAATVCGERAAEAAPAGNADRAWRGSSYGVGQLLDAARTAGAARVVIGVAGITVWDAGAGALSGLGLRLQVADGSGLKIGVDELHRLARIERGWLADWSGIEVRVVADRTDTLRASIAVDSGAVHGEPAARARSRFADIVERDLGAQGLAGEAATGAGHGAAFALGAAIGARLVDPLGACLGLCGPDDALATADLLVVVSGAPSPAALDGPGRAVACADGVEYVELAVDDEQAVHPAVMDAIGRSAVASRLRQR